eukprot:CAMPEP_0174250282 /NCGR_PEP_ID=MMETSP0439-20130205/501_1 /TAXON_ID=0 /ORGANISM="Stereomyxa ramosa, Strain Chinc5" /LENGTH=204 /DNA_ID=CAMNT_0015330305 /DNA_START=23 /DNA_END=637 /DNA_ORIENTATION=+
MSWNPFRKDPKDVHVDYNNVPVGDNIDLMRGFAEGVGGGGVGAAAIICNGVEQMLQQCLQRATRQEQCAEQALALTLCYSNEINPDQTKKYLQNAKSYSPQQIESEFEKLGQVVQKKVTEWDKQDHTPAPLSSSEIRAFQECGSDAEMNCLVPRVCPTYHVNFGTCLSRNTDISKCTKEGVEVLRCWGDVVRRKSYEVQTQGGS